LAKWQIILLLLISTQTFAQFNLVPNPSFEDTTSCNPFVPPIANWTIALGSPKYFNQLMPSCAFANNGFNNIFGYQVAANGKAYMGFEAYSLPYGSNSRGIIQAQLLNQMVAGAKYCISFFVNCANKSKYATDDIGCYFSVTPTITIPVPAQINTTSGSFITDTAGWTNIKSIYTALGGEKYISIGNFKNDTNTTVVINNPGSVDSNAYYFVDKVSLVKLPTTVAGTDATICQGAPTAQLSATCNGCWAGLKYVWNPAAGLDNDTILNPVASPPVTTTYYFSLIDTAGTVPCFENMRDSVTITVCKYRVGVVNVFTPNNDGVNDVFQTINEHLITLDCKIYNRWGTLVRELTKFNEVWDGRTSAGVECSAGVYYYVVNAIGENGANINEKGFVELIK
jgi:gliding motility-associated-like protein